MIGAIAGDIIGSVYEWKRIKTKEFPLFDGDCRFTDDSVLTIAVADAILTGQSYLQTIRAYGLRHPDAGYGGAFVRWLASGSGEPYGSWGNGSAMRVSAVGHAFENAEDVLREAKRSAEVTHDHPEGIKGAQATALAVFRARAGAPKEEIRSEIAARFGYDLSSTVDAIRPAYRFDVSCQGTVPAALIAFLDSTSYEDAVRNAVSLGGDSDTLACIAGSIAEAHYGGVPAEIQERALLLLTTELRDVVLRFRDMYIPAA
ncbi:MAG TPA: ADP-ribosylglycohydrolase family protein [Chthonomonadaceae bacterium]|nr:ADP-ribosylglycohydrolase family protein [Chthonomonadaceae bacterium]